MNDTSSVWKANAKQFKSKYINVYICKCMCIYIYAYKRTKNNYLLEDPYTMDKQCSLCMLSVHLSVTVDPQTTFISLVFMAYPEIH